MNAVLKVLRKVVEVFNVISIAGLLFMLLLPAAGKVGFLLLLLIGIGSRLILITVILVTGRTVHVFKGVTALRAERGAVFNLCTALRTKTHLSVPPMVFFLVIL